VPFNTLYKGGEILHILKDSGAKVLFALTNFAPMINEIRPELPDLEQVILTGERNLLFAHPDNTAFVQLILSLDAIRDLDEAYQTMGNVLLKSIQRLGVKEAWYKHRGSIRVRGDKIATFVIAELEGTALINAVLFLGPLETRDFLRVVWVWNKPSKWNSKKAPWSETNFLDMKNSVLWPTKRDNQRPATELGV
jgi:long-chain acyl-CoA synthetase